MLIASLQAILMFVAGIALLTTILLRRTYRQVGRRNRRYDSRPIDTQPRPENAWSGAKADNSATLERQKVELAEFTRDANGQIDTKIRMLRQLIAQSEKQIERMEQLLAQAEAKESTVAGETRP